MKVQKLYEVYKVTGDDDNAIRVELYPDGTCVINRLHVRDESFVEEAIMLIKPKL